jgi:hypothetical protein
MLILRLLIQRPAMRAWDHGMRKGIGAMLKVAIL